MISSSLVVELVVKYPRWITVLMLALPLGLSTYGMLFFEQNDLAGWDIRRSSSAIGFDTFVEGQDRVREGNVEEDNVAERSDLSTRYLDVFFVSHSGDFLGNPAQLFAIRAFESEIMETELIKKICLLESNGSTCVPPRSVTEYLPVNESDFSRNQLVVDLILNEGETKFSVSSAFDYETSNANEVVMPKIRSRFLLGVPLPGFKDANDRVSVQNDKIMQVVQELSLNEIEPRQDSIAGVKIYFDFLDLTAFFAFRTLVTDSIFGGGSIVIVLIMIGIHTGSIFLAAVGLFQILLSFPLTYFIYRILFGIIHFGTLQVLAIYLILGIGADDVFIFFDAFRQSKVMLADQGLEGDELLKERLKWAFKRAVGAMSVTSLTTFAAFFVTALNPIINIRNFGIFTALLVMVNFLLVVVLWPCFLVIYVKHVQPYRACLCCCGILSTKSPADDDRHADEKISQQDLGKLETFYLEKYGPKLLRARYVVIGMIFAIVALFFYFASRFEPSSKRIEDIFAEDHPVTIVNRMKVSDFIFGEEAALTAEIVFGLNPIDRATASLFDPSIKGEFSFNQDFEPLDPLAQEKLLDLCQELENQPFTRTKSFPNEEVVRCWISDFRIWLESVQPNGTFPLTDQTATRHAMETWFFSDPAAVEKHLGSIYGIFGNDTAYLPDPILFTSVGIVLEPRKTFPLPDKLKGYYDLETYLEETLVDTPSLGKALIASYDFVVLEMQDTLILSSLIGLGSGIAFGGLVMIVMTRNLRLTIASLLSVISITGMVLGTMNLLGWQIGFMEAIAITALIGLSLDYTIHIVLAYKELDEEETIKIARVNPEDCLPGDFTMNGDPSRLLRTRCALGRVGVSVVGGAITTAGAAVALSLAQIQYLGQFGLFLVMVILYALFISNVLLPSILGVIGPENNVANSKVDSESIEAIASPKLVEEEL